MVTAQHVLPSLVAAAVRAAPLTPEKVEFAWGVAGGPAIARATTVLLREDGVLVVASSDPQWGQAVLRMRAQLVRQLEPYLGPGIITRIELAEGAARARRTASRSGRL